MRIIAGKYKGRPLLQPPLKTTRPTTDKIRQAIFNILEHTFDLRFEDLIILDAFAGSGAMGFEALSRNAKHVTSIEKSKSAIVALKQNQQNLRIEEDHISIIHQDILKTSFHGKKFDLVFLDPPYQEEDLYQQTIDLLILENALHEKTIICVEALKGKKLLLKGIILDERIYGQTKIIFLNSKPQIETK